MAKSFLSREIKTKSESVREREKKVHETHISVICSFIRITDGFAVLSSSLALLSESNLRCHSHVIVERSMLNLSHESARSSVLVLSFALGLIE
jgi:hypothetical protein